MVSNSLSRNNFDCFNSRVFRLWFAALASVDNNNEDNLLIRLNKNQFLNQFGYRDLKKFRYDDVRTKMLGQQISVFDADSGECVFYPVFDMISINENDCEDFIVFHVNDRIVPHFNPKKNDLDFVLIKYVDILALDVGFESDLYWKLYSYRFRKQFTLSMNDLKTMFGDVVNDFAHFHYFKWIPAVNKINSRTDLKVEYKIIQEGKKDRVKGIELILSSNYVSSSKIDSFNNGIKKCVDKDLGKNGDYCQKDFNNYSLTLPIFSIIEKMKLVNNYSIDNKYAFISRLILPAQRAFNGDVNNKYKWFVREDYDDKDKLVFFFTVKNKADFEKKKTINIDGYELISVNDSSDLANWGEISKYIDELDIPIYIKYKYYLYCDFSVLDTFINDIHCIELTDFLIRECKSHIHKGNMECDDKYVDDKEFSMCEQTITFIGREYELRKGDLSLKTSVSRKNYIKKMIDNYDWEKTLEIFTDDYDVFSE